MAESGGWCFCIWTGNMSQDEAGTVLDAVVEQLEGTALWIGASARRVTDDEIEQAMLSG